jgi:hypothetical protein
MNFPLFRITGLIISVTWMGLWIAVFWAGFQGLEQRVGWIGSAVGIFAPLYFRNWNNPILIGAYLHAVNAWSWNPATSGLLAASPGTLMMIQMYFSLPRANKPAWKAELMSLLIFSLMLCLNTTLLGAGFEGIENRMGLTSAIIAVAANMCRLVIGFFAIGAYFEATNAWGWNPAMAVHFIAAPAICFLLGCWINKYLFLGGLTSWTRARDGIKP